MKKLLIIIPVFFLLSFAKHSDKDIHIDRGRIEGNWTMTITDEYYLAHDVVSSDVDITTKHFTNPITIKPNEFFSLSELGLKAIPSRYTGYDAPPPEVQVAKERGLLLHDFVHGYTHAQYRYGVVIDNKDNHRKYYGMIVFNMAYEEAAGEAVTDYYKITFPSSYFASCVDGRISYFGEYYKINKDYKYTWEIFVSDAPLDPKGCSVKDN